MTADEQMKNVADEPLVIDHVLVLLEQYKRDLATAHLRIRELEADARLRSAELELRARLQQAVQQRCIAYDQEPFDDEERVLLAFRPIAGSPGFLEEILRHIRARRLLLSLSREQLGRIVTTLTRAQTTQLRDLYASWAFPESRGAS